MDTNKKILIGAISAAVVIGGVAIGLILSQAPERQTFPPYTRKLPLKVQRRLFPPPQKLKQRLPLPRKTAIHPVSQQR